MMYKIVKNEDNDLVSIHETSTGNIILTDVSFSEAKATRRTLNMGGGFDGWTPDFFLNRLIINEGIS